MKEKLDELMKTAEGIQGGLDSHIADEIRLKIQELAQGVLTMLDNRSRVK